MNWPQLYQLRKLWVIVVLALSSMSLTAGRVARAQQIVPDDSLGAESSAVRTVAPQVEQIDGGATRGSNLFHSFEEFNINEGWTANFANPASIENILSRVTGSNGSDIYGTLGVLGDANLFLLNPNGIIFGPNAQLDINGSFYASTADSFTFPDGREFSATNPGDAGLLSVNVPLGVQYGPGASGALANEGVLAVNPNQGLTLDGETVLNSGTLIAPGGAINVLGDDIQLTDNAMLDVSATTGGGTILIGGDFKGEGTVPTAQTTFIGPDVVIRADGIENANGGRVSVWSDNNTDFQGTITAQGGTLGGDGGFIETSGREGLRVAGTVNAGATNGDAGTWLIDPTNITIVENGGGNIGEGVVNADNIEATLNNGTDVEITTDIGGNEEGNITQEQGADILWESGSDLTLRANNNIILNGNIRAENGSNITIDAAGEVRINGEDAGIFNQVAQGAVENGGDIIIEATSFELSGRADLSASTFGEGDAGSIIINARDSVLISGDPVSIDGDREITNIFNRSNTPARGDAGNIIITTNSFEFIDGADMSTSTFGGGDAGNVIINATDSVLITGANTEITSRVNQPDEPLGEPIQPVNGGSIRIETTSFTLSNGASLITDTNIEGGDIERDAGLIRIEATDSVLITGGDTEITSKVNERVRGDAGDIEIVANSFQLSDGAELNTSTSGSGDAGQITIGATESVRIDGNGTFIFNNVARGGVGNAGTTTIITDGSLEISDRAQISSSTFGEGNAGEITIGATDSVLITGASTLIFNNVELGGVGDAGNTVIITGGSLEMSDGAQIQSIVRGGPGGGNDPSAGQGNAGSISIIAGEKVSLSGVNPTNNNLATRLSTTLQAGTRNNPEGESRIGNISIITPSLEVTDGAEIAVDAQRDAAGIIAIGADNIHLNNGSLTATTRSGTGGNIFLQSPNSFRENDPEFAEGLRLGREPETFLIVMQNESLISAEALGGADGGNIFINIEFDANGNEILDVEDETLVISDIADLVIDNQVNGEPVSDEVGLIENNNSELQTGFIVADRNNNDILATAEEGRGGNIIANVEGIFGLEERDIPPDGDIDSLRDNSTSDISASSEVGVDGDVLLFTLNVDPTRGLGELPLDITDPSRLVAEGCVAAAPSDDIEPQGEFTQTGRGGLSADPTDVLTDDALLEQPSPANQTDLSDSTPATASDSEAQPLIEAQGLVVNANNKVELSSDMFTTPNTPPTFIPNACGAT